MCLPISPMMASSLCTCVSEWKRTTKRVTAATSRIPTKTECRRMRVQLGCPNRAGRRRLLRAGIPPSSLQSKIRRDEAAAMPEMAGRRFVICTDRLAQVLEYKTGPAEIADEFLPRMQIFDGPRLAIRLVRHTGERSG